MMLSKKISGIKESETLKFTPLLEKLRKKQEIIDFAVGELDFETPKEIKEAVKKALDRDKTRYSNVSGIRELKQSIANEDEIGYNPENIAITNGSKQALYSIFQAVCNPGDEVIIPKPCWVSFEEQVKLADAKPVFADTINHQLDVDKIKELVNRNTKAIIINSPNNPTGAVCKKEDLKAIGELAIDNDFFVISDEAYSEIIYDNLKYHNFMSLFPERQKNFIIVKSFSKIFSMTGFRVGYIMAEKEIISSLNKLQGHMTGNVCTFAQYGAIAALKMDKSFIKKRVSILEKRRDLAYGLTKKLFGCTMPQGAFYLFPNIKDSLNHNIKNSEALAAYLLEKAGVAVVPGEFFKADNHIRISYAVEEEEIKKGFERIAKALNS